MEIIKTRDWYYTDDEQPRGYIQPGPLKELWFHTGTACNLACPFCLEGSKPGDDRLQLLRLDDAKPLIDEAVDLGVQQFSFTGGEPFVAREFVRILAYASQRKPCLVLTNATDPLLRRRQELEPLARDSRPVSFRVSLDSPDASRHDTGRGEGSFDKAIEGLRLLQGLGFHVSIARQIDKGEDTEAVDRRYRSLLQSRGIDGDIPIVAFPDFASPFAHVATPAITEDCMTRYQTEAKREQFMCAFSKMVVKQQGRTRIYACTLVDDDPRYGFEGSLRESMEERVMLNHHRCYSCFAYGASCSEI